MQIFLTGAEYKAYREIMQEVGVRYGCVNFSYIWERDPSFRFEELDFLEEIMVIPGRITMNEFEEYKHFLNANSEFIDFALAPLHFAFRCGVPIVPRFNPAKEIHTRMYVTFGDMKRPFRKIHAKQLIDEKGILFHGVEVDEPFVESMSSSTWMHGTSGINSDWRNDKMFIRFGREYSTSIARRLILEGYDLNLLKIKKNDWQEIAKMNCIQWKKRQEYEDG